jgi:hypothetical protein
VRYNRARIGYENKYHSESDWQGNFHYKPFTNQDLSAPPPTLASSGRLNRQGVSFLYLATDEETSLSEVRPHPGQKVSVGAFKSSRGLRVADFRKISILNYCDSDEHLEEFVFFKRIDELFSLPIPPEDRGKYTITQFLSDAIRHLGFDGIGYKSSVAKGSNLVLFDPSSFTYEPNSAKVVEILELQYRHSHLTVVNPNECDYYEVGGLHLFSQF